MIEFEDLHGLVLGSVKCNLNHDKPCRIFKYAAQLDLRFTKPRTNVLASFSGHHRREGGRGASVENEKRAKELRQKHFELAKAK